MMITIILIAVMMIIMIIHILIIIMIIIIKAGAERGRLTLENALIYRSAAWIHTPARWQTHAHTAYIVCTVHREKGDER